MKENPATILKIVVITIHHYTYHGESQ